MKLSVFTKRILAPGLLLLLICIFAFLKCGRVKKSELNLGTVTKADLTQKVTISGQVWPRKRLDIKPPFNGYITKLYVKVGDRLKMHDPLVTFSPSLAGGETNFPIRTGFDGTVTQVLKSEGEYVTETGDQLLVLRLEDLSDLAVLATVPELDVAKIKVGQEAVIKISSIVGESFKGKITEISLSARDKDKYGSASTEFQVKVSIDSHDPRLFTGMSCVMDIITEKRKGILILGHEYIQEDEASYFALTDKGEKKRLKLGLQTDEAAQVLSGLNEGDKVRAIDFLSLPETKD